MRVGYNGLSRSTNYRKYPPPPAAIKLHPQECSGPVPPVIKLLADYVPVLNDELSLLSCQFLLHRRDTVSVTPPERVRSPPLATYGGQETERHAQQSICLIRHANLLQSADVVKLRQDIPSVGPDLNLLISVYISLFLSISFLIPSFSNSLSSFLIYYVVLSLFSYLCISFFHSSLLSFLFLPFLFHLFHNYFYTCPSFRILLIIYFYFPLAILLSFLTTQKRGQVRSTRVSCSWDTGFKSLTRLGLCWVYRWFSQSLKSNARYLLTSGHDRFFPSHYSVTTLPLWAVQSWDINVLRS